MSWLRCLLVTLCALATPVWAHSSLDRSEPTDGAVLKQAPREIQMWFTEPIKVELSVFEVRDSTGKQVDKRDLRADEKEPALVRLSLPANLGSGVYEVTWSAVALDLHVAMGSFSFRIAP